MTGDDEVLIWHFPLPARVQRDRLRQGVNQTRTETTEASGAYLWEAALVIQDAQDAIGFQGDEVDAGLVVSKGDLSPVHLLPDVFLL